MARETIAAWKNTAQTWKNRTRRLERRIGQWQAACVMSYITCLVLLACWWNSSTSPASTATIASEPHAFVPEASTPARVSASVIVGQCSGTIFHVESGTAWGLGCAHCARIGATVTLKTHDGRTGTATYVAKDTASDLSLFRTDAALISGVALIAPPSARPILNRIECIGYPSYSDGKRMRRRMLTYNREHHIDNLTGIRACFKGGAGMGGESGCGLFHDGDFLVGVLSHRSDEHQTTMAATHAQICAFLDANRGYWRTQTYCTKNGCYTRRVWVSVPDYKPPAPEVPTPLPNTHKFPWPDKTVTAWIKRHEADFATLSQRMGVIQSAVEELKKRPPGDGKPGANGENGKPGVGIKSASVSPAGNLILTLTDGSTIDAGKVKGDKGASGDNGSDGGPGQVTVVLVDESGKEIKRGVARSGDVVRLTKRLLTKGK